jgi:hypothetical protein
MNALAFILICVIILLVIAFVVMLIITLRKENPFKPAFASLVGAFVIWFSHLFAPDLDGQVDLNLDLHPVFTMHGTALRTSSKIPFGTEFLALASLLALIFLCSTKLGSES